MTHMRTNEWLESNMWNLLENHFADIPVKNDIQISFGRRARQRLGSIKREFPPVKGRCPNIMRAVGIGEAGNLLTKFLTPSDSLFSKEGKESQSPTIITITGYFKDPGIPDYVVTSTVAHELAHYAHGFSSPLEQRFEHPHRGGVVCKELEARGLGKMQKDAKKWLKENWRNYLMRVAK